MSSYIYVEIIVSAIISTLFLSRLTVIYMYCILVSVIIVLVDGIIIWYTLEFYTNS